MGCTGILPSAPAELVTSNTVPVPSERVKPLQALIPAGGCRSLCLGAQKDIPGTRGEGWEGVHPLEGSSVWGFRFWFFGPVQCQNCITMQEAQPKPGTSSGVQLGMSSPAIPGFFGIDRLGNGKESPTRSGWQGPRTALPVQAKLGERCQGCSSGRARCQPHTSVSPVRGRSRRIPNPANAPAAASRQDQSTASAGRGSLLPTTQSHSSLPEPPPNCPPSAAPRGATALGRGLCMPWQTQGKSILFGVILVFFYSKEAKPLGFP